MISWLRGAAALGLMLALVGCGGGDAQPPASLRPDELPIPPGRAPAFRVPAVSATVARRAPLAKMRCLTTHGRSYGIHLELYAQRLVLPVPAGIGIAPPQRRRGVYVLGGACSYAIRTFEPTGVVLVDRSGARQAPTLGVLFSVWGQQLSGRALAGFRGHVLAFLNGRPWNGSPRAIPLQRHAEIVLQLGDELPPHRSYEFPPGL